MKEFESPERPTIQCSCTTCLIVEGLMASRNFHKHDVDLISLMKQRFYFGFQPQEKQQLPQFVDGVTTILTDRLNLIQIESPTNTYPDLSLIATQDSMRKELNIYLLTLAGLSRKKDI